VKRSPTPTLEDDEQYEDKHCNYEAERKAHRRDRGEDLIWHTRMQREERTSISVHGNLTFVKHSYVYVNVDMITVRPRFMQQE
jgi:hypothetical protein